MLNKKQQILEFLAKSSDPRTGIEPNSYSFWRDDDGQQITFANWSTVLQQARNNEMLSVRMQKETPSIVVVSPPAQASSAPLGSADAASTTTTTGTMAAAHAVPKTKDFTLKTKAFLAWKMQDEFGEEEKSPVEERVSKFLRAIYLRLPVPTDMTAKERMKRPQADSEKRAQADRIIAIQQRFFNQLQEHINAAAPKLGAFAQDTLGRSKALLLLFVPSDLGADFDSDAIRVFWGAVSEILQVSSHI